MQNSILTSTALLTVLLLVGLVFFIRASAKDRTEVAQFVTSQQGEPLFEQLQQYFTQRSYRLSAVDAEQNQVKYSGFVRPSAFLAIFLSGLAAIGMFCLALVLGFLFPAVAQFFLGLVLLAPAAGVFYWRKAGRQEEVLLRMGELADTESGSTQQPRSLLTVTAHRDEVAEMQRILGLKPLED